MNQKQFLKYLGIKIKFALEFFDYYLCKFESVVDVFRPHF